MQKELLCLWDVLETWPGVRITPDRRGLALALGRERLGHVGWSGRIELPFPPEVCDRLVAEGMAERDADQPDANRAVLVIGTAADAERALWLLRLGYLLLQRKVRPRATEPAPSIECLTRAPTISAHTGETSARPEAGFDPYPATHSRGEARSGTRRSVGNH